jgi:hypothetical protein
MASVPPAERLVQLDEPLLPTGGIHPDFTITEDLGLHVPGDPVLLQPGMVLIEAKRQLTEPFLTGDL